MHRGKVIAASVVAAVALLLILWGSGSGTVVLHAPTGQEGEFVSEPPRADTVQETTSAEALDPGAGEMIAPTLDWLMIAFALIALAIVVKILQWLVNRDWEESEAPAEDDLSDDLGLLLQATSEQARSAALSEGEPRNVVVRSWVALEDAAASSGLDRDPAETAAEFTRRFLGVWDVDESSTQELAELYREARFSRHPVSREVGDRAVAVVGSIHEQLRRAAVRQAETQAETQGETGAEAETQAGAAASTTDGERG